MSRVLALLTILHVACKQPKQPLQASYFSTHKPNADKNTCAQTLDCYAACQPLVEECMLICDRKGTTQEVQRARKLSYCAARNSCEIADRTCEQEHCGTELNACTAPRVAPAPSPMQPPPPMQPGRAGYPTARPYPAARPYPDGRPPPPGYRPPPPGYGPPPPPGPNEPAPPGPR